MSTDAQGPTIVLLTNGLRDTMIWGETIVARHDQQALRAVFPGSTVLLCDRDDLPRLAQRRVDLLVSSYTGPHPPWRADDVAGFVSGVTILNVMNRPDLLDGFAHVAVDGFVSNSRRAVEVLGRSRPAAFLPLAADDSLRRVPLDQRYRAAVVYLGSGGRGNKRPETAHRYLDPAKAFDFALWGHAWDEAYWAPVHREDPEVNDWHRSWRGPLPLDDIAALYSSADIVLGYHEDRQREWGMWNNRVYEALACGALFVSDDAAGLHDAFGEAVVITEGGVQTRDLIEHFAAHPEERRRRGEIGARIVRERFTYRRRALSLRVFYEQLARSRGLDVSWPEPPPGSLDARPAGVAEAATDG